MELLVVPNNQLNGNGIYLFEIVTVKSCSELDFRWNQNNLVNDEI